MKVEIQKTDHRVPFPSQAHESDTGYDLHAVIDQPLTLEPGVPHLIDTGIRLRPVVEETSPHEPPNPRIDIQIRPRSGWSSKGVLVHLGTVDSGYRGNLKVSMINISKNPIDLFPGAKIAQLVFSQLVHVRLQRVDSVEIDSSRAENGFGSSGF